MTSRDTEKQQAGEGSTKDMKSVPAVDTHGTLTTAAVKETMVATASACAVANNSLKKPTTDEVVPFGVSNGDEDSKNLSVRKRRSGGTSGDSIKAPAGTNVGVVATDARFSVC